MARLGPQDFIDLAILNCAPKVAPGHVQQLVHPVSTAAKLVLTGRGQENVGVNVVVAHYFDCTPLPHRSNKCVHYVSIPAEQLLQTLNLEVELE